MSIYVKFDGITGSVTTEGYQGWTEVDQLEFNGINVSTSNVVGKAPDRINSRPSFGEYTIVKPMDISSPYLVGCIHSGKVIPKVEIDCVTTGNPPFTYLKTTLTSVLLNHYSRRHSSAGGKPIEYISMTYTGIEETLSPRDASNKIGTPITTGYNLTTAQKM